MASRRRAFFDYDPYDYYYPASTYGDPYYNLPTAADAFFRDAEPAEPLFYPHRQRPASARRAPARNDDVFDIEITEPAAREPTARSGSSKRSQPASFPIEVTGPDPLASKRRVPSVEEAAVKLQAVARGLVARKTVREVRAVERVAEAVAEWVAAQAEALRGDARARVVVGEELMRLLLRLDGVRGAREYRRRVTRRVLALQDAVDALETMPPAMVTDAPKAQDVEEEAGMALQLPVESSTEENTLAAETDTSTEVDGVSPVVVVGDADQIEPELVAEGEKATEEEGEWEMVATVASDVSTGEKVPPPAKEQQQQEQAGEEKKTEVASVADGLDAKKLMEMVAELCEQSAQQCTLIEALAERVDTLERTVRRVEEADRHRRRNKKINKETKKSAKGFYSD